MTLNYKLRVLGHKFQQWLGYHGRPLIVPSILF